MPSSLTAALMRAIQSALISRLRLRRAYCPAFITASLATRKTLAGRGRKPLAFLRTFLWRARAVTPRLTLGMARSSAGVRQHRAHRALVAVVDVGGAAQVALPLGGLLGEDVAHERLRALDRTARADLEPLRGRFLRLHLGHSIAPICYSAAAGFAAATGSFDCVASVASFPSFAFFASFGALG